MKKMYNYTQFNLNERNRWLTWIHDKFLNTLSGWTKDFYNMLKNGLIRKIPSGPNAGKPWAILFLPDQEMSIVEQLRNYKMSSISENKVPLEHPVLTNVGTEDLKRDIIEYYQVKLKLAQYADMPDEQKDPDDDVLGMKAKPIFIYGAPGVGKTELVAFCCDYLKIPLLFLDVQFMNPEDFKGIPKTFQYRNPTIEDGKILDPGAGFTRDNPPSVFPRDNGSGRFENKGGIIFMDELNRSNPIVLNTMMQFVQQGRIGSEYTLPNKWCLVAAGNRKDDDPSGNIAEVGTALTSRFSVVNYVPNYDKTTGKSEGIGEWKAWAKRELGIVPELISYLDTFPEELHVNDPNDEKQGSFPSPRSWTEASKILYGKLYLKNHTTWRNAGTDLVRSIFRKEIGIKSTDKFVKYLTFLENYTPRDLQLIIEDPSRAKDMTIDTQYPICIANYLKNIVDDIVDEEKNHAANMNLIKYFNRMSKIPGCNSIFITKIYEVIIDGDKTLEEEVKKIKK
jgi:hypothetical protein